ncbi:MAG: hypothetical protein ACTSUS_03620 [Candidatus Freyarchaeota archaeon]
MVEVEEVSFTDIVRFARSGIEKITKEEETSLEEGMALLTFGLYSVAERFVEWGRSPSEWLEFVVKMSLDVYSRIVRRVSEE